MGELLDFVRNASGRIGIPQEILTGLPVIELTGDAAIMIEQHKGVCAYSEESVSVNTNLGVITVQGDGLTIHVMNRDRIMIYGRICAVQIERRAR